MIFELAMVEDKGTYFNVTGVTKNTLDGLANRDEKMLKLSYNSYKIIKDALDENKLVSISKEMKTDEVMPDEITISDVDIDDLQEYKKMASQRIGNTLSYKLAKISALDILDFTLLNNELISEGYAITQNNREEKYIEIIETDNEKLIGILEEYLNILDKVKESTNIRKFSKIIIKSIMNCNTIKGIDKALEIYFDGSDDEKGLNITFEEIPTIIEDVDKDNK